MLRMHNPQEITSVSFEKEGECARRGGLDVMEERFH
jgi:hypothetical protein